MENALKRLKEQPDMDALWAALQRQQGQPFHTFRGLEFTYGIRGGAIIIDRKEKTITKSTVEMAYKRVLELKGEVKGPKKLGVFGASYLYPIFAQMGLINPPTPPANPILTPTSHLPTNH